MIYNQWYAVLESKEVKRNKLVGVTRFGEKLVFWRDSKGNVSCLWDKCAHRGAALSAGKIVDDAIFCPFHGLRYDLSGKCIEIPSRGKTAEVPENFIVNNYVTREKHGFIWVWWGKKREEYPELPFFEDIDDKFTYSTHACHWKTHYSRVIENQLDVAHVPFVHYNTIGRGNARIMDGPPYKLINDEINIWFTGHKEDGTIGKLPNEVEIPNKNAILHFRFPNLWQNYLHPKVRVFISFVPIDENNAMVYTRFYQKFIRIPILRHLINAFGNFFDKIILHQDRRVVETQEPKRSGLTIGENLFPADGPIILYRRLREKLKKENNQKTNL